LFPRHCEERLRRSNPVFDSRRDGIASLALAMTRASRTAVMPAHAGIQYAAAYRFNY